MRFNTHQQEIVKKIASGEITDIVSYVKAFNLFEVKKLDKEEIERRFAEEETGKPYKISYDDARGVVETTDGLKYYYYYFKGINIVNSFADIKNFLVIWQFLKSEGLVLEVNKQPTVADYELFFEYKPTSETKFAKYIERRSGKTLGVENNEKVAPKSDSGNLTVDSLSEEYQIRDYRRYSDYYFEYNKANEMICSQFLDKQIYGTADLDLFIKKGYKTGEQINFVRALIPAYLALILSIILAFIPQDNSDLEKIQEQLNSIEQTIRDISLTQDVSESG